MALEGHKLIQRDFKTGGYRPGERLFELGMCAISQLGLCAHARPILGKSKLTLRYKNMDCVL